MSITNWTSRERSAQLTLPAITQEVTTISTASGRYCKRSLDALPLTFPPPSLLFWDTNRHHAGIRASLITSIDCNSTQRLFLDRKSTRLNSSHSQISYAVFCLKKK